MIFLKTNEQSHAVSWLSIHGGIRPWMWKLSWPLREPLRVGSPFILAAQQESNKDTPANSDCIKTLLHDAGFQTSWALGPSNANRSFDFFLYLLYFTGSSPGEMSKALSHPSQLGSTGPSQSRIEHIRPKSCAFSPLQCMNKPRVIPVPADWNQDENCGS